MLTTANADRWCAVIAMYPDTFAALLGIGVSRLGPGVVEADLMIGPHHLNPHGTAHGAVIYALGGVALGAAANDADHSGVVSSVHVDYVRPAAMGEHLTARAEITERLDREDLFVVHVVRGPERQLVARLSGRATRRSRAAS